MLNITEVASKYFTPLAGNRECLVGKYIKATLGWLAVILFVSLSVEAGEKPSTTYEALSNIDITNSDANFLAVSTSKNYQDDESYVYSVKVFFEDELIGTMNSRRKIHVRNEDGVKSPNDVNSTNPDIKSIDKYFLKNTNYKQRDERVTGHLMMHTNRMVIRLDQEQSQSKVLSFTSSNDWKIIDTIPENNVLVVQGDFFKETRDALKIPESYTGKPGQELEFIHSLFSKHLYDVAYGIRNLDHVKFAIPQLDITSNIIDLTSSTKFMSASKDETPFVGTWWHDDIRARIEMFGDRYDNIYHIVAQNEGAPQMTLVNEVDQDSLEFIMNREPENTFMNNTPASTPISIDHALLIEK